MDETLGTIDYVFALDSVVPAGVSGGGSLAIINFRATQPGVCPVVYVEVVLSKRGGESIEHQSQNGQVRVVLIRSTDTPTPRYSATPTPTETLTPSTTPTSCCPPLPTPTCTATPTRVCRAFVWPEDQEKLVGHSGSLDLVLENVPDLYAVEMHLTYDPSIIAIQDAGFAPGTQLGAGTIFAGRDWHEDLQQVDETAGTIDYVFALDSSNATGVSGSGSLAHIDFWTLQPGTCVISYTEIILAHKSGASIPCTTSDGRVRVVSIRSTATSTPMGGVPATPTATPSPTPTLEGGATRAQVYLDPSVRHLLPGAMGWVDIRIRDATHLYGAWVGLDYDPRLEIVDADPSTPGIQLEAGDLFAGKQWYTLANEVDPVTGSIIYGAKMSFVESPDVSEGCLARIHVRGSELGIFPLSFNLVVLSDNTGTSIPAQDQGGYVQVALHLPTPTDPPPTPGGPTLTPTVTPSPTTEPGLLPLLYVAPDSVSLAVGEEAALQIRVRDVINLYSVEFYVLYDPTVIEVLDEDPGVPGVQVGFGAFLSPHSVMQNSVDAVQGRINFAISQTEPTPGKNGEGAIAHFRIRALTEGATPLALFGTKLWDRTAAAIAHGSAGGVVAVNSRVVVGHAFLGGRLLHAGAQVQHEGAVVGTTADDGGFAFACPVGVGSPLSVVIEHMGYLTACKTIAVPVDQTVDLGSVTLLGGDVAGPQVAATRAAGCPGEGTVAMPGLPDGRINIIDLTFVSSRFGTVAADPEWQPSPDGCHPEWISGRGDINGDGQCNIFDIVQVGNNFGASGPLVW